MTIRVLFAALALACAFVSPATAKPHPDCNITMPCEGVMVTPARRAPVRMEPRATVASQIVGGRPSGCPRRFCGCGASLHLFGRIVPSLNLAANWLRFPRAAPAPGMAAARRGHVMVLKQHLGGSTWLVHDSNSGGGKTRLHARSIAGFAVVNPHGSAS